MKTKVIAIIMMMLFLASITAIAVPVRAEYCTPNIDGVISAGEWGALTFRGYDYNVYVLNDVSFLYVAFEADGGDFILYPGMTNIYIYLGTDYAVECWAYSVLGSDGTPGLDHFTIHHIQSPKVKEGKESRTTAAQVAIATTVMEWKIPFNELWSSLSLGESMAFDFLSYSEGMSGWDTAWMYEQYYTLAQPQAYWFKASGGGVSYSDAKGTLDHYCTIGLIGMSLESSTGIGDRVLCKGSGTFVDHELKIKISFNIEEGAIWRADNLIYFWGTANVFDIYNHEKAYGVPFRLGLVDDEYSGTNRFDVQCYGNYWHGTLLPDSEVTVWVWE